MPPKSVCPVCTYANPRRNPRCEACGAVLDADAEPERPARPRGALWLDLEPKAAPKSSAPDAPDVLVTLRDVVVAPPPVVRPMASVDGPELIGDPAEAPRPRAPSPPPAQRSRAEQRAAVRRARRRARTDVVPSTEVLVYDADEDGRAPLCGWLRAFGFEVCQTADPGEAWALVRLRRFAAVFVDVPFDDRDGGAGVQLCKLVKSQSRDRGEAVLLVLASRALSHVERVAAELAGCDAFIVKPATRGAVAGVLDRHGIALPSDARGGG